MSTKIRTGRWRWHLTGLAVVLVGVALWAGWTGILPAFAGGMCAVLGAAVTFRVAEGSMSKPHVCPLCDGTGRASLDGKTDMCRACKGACQEAFGVSRSRP